MPGKGGGDDYDLYMLNEDSAWLFDKCIRKSKAIVTCSEFTKQDILDRYAGISADKITVIPWGIDHNMFYPRKSSDVLRLRESYGIKERYFFSCSCNSPRKNVDVVLDAFSKFSQTCDDVSMVLAWGNPPKELLDRYAREIEQKKIVFLPFVSDDDLAIMYSGALASVFVSSFEGFGFPILESMACGTPVITCRNSSLAEIGGSHAIYVKERDVKELADCMRHIYEGDMDIRGDELISHAESYTWDDTASEYIKFYKRALEV